MNNPYKQPNQPEYDSWSQQALCAEVDPELFYPEVGHAPTAKAAKEICKHCVVRVECLEEALTVNDLYGIRGGMTYSERKKLRRAR